MVAENAGKMVALETVNVPRSQFDDRGGAIFAEYVRVPTAVSALPSDRVMLVAATEISVPAARSLFTVKLALKMTALPVIGEFISLSKNTKLLPLNSTDQLPPMA